MTFLSRLLARYTIRTVVGPEEICGWLGHVELTANQHTDGASLVLRACGRCGAVLEQKVYTDRYPRPV